MKTEMAIVVCKPSLSIGLLEGDFIVSLRFFWQGRAGLFSFLSFAKSFGGNADSTVAAIARGFECIDAVSDKTENEKIVSLSRYFGENSFVVIETVSEFEPSY